MGTYDSIWVDGVEWQTKGLGRHLANYRFGDAVMVERIPTTEEDYDIARTFHYDELPDRYLVEAAAREYFLVEHGRLTRIATQADQEELFLDRFDYCGRDEHDEIHKLIPGAFEPHRPPRAFHPGQPPLSQLPRCPRRRNTEED